MRSSSPLFAWACAAERIGARAQRRFRGAAPPAARFHLFCQLLVPDGIHGFFHLLSTGQRPLCSPHILTRMLLQKAHSSGICTALSHALQNSRIRKLADQDQGAAHTPHPHALAESLRLRAALSPLHVVPNSRIPHAHGTRMALLASWKWSRSTAIDTWKKNLPPAPALSIQGRCSGQPEKNLLQRSNAEKSAL